MTSPGLEKGENSPSQGLANAGEASIASAVQPDFADQILRHLDYATRSDLEKGERVGAGLRSTREIALSFGIPTPVARRTLRRLYNVGLINECDAGSDQEGIIWEVANRRAIIAASR